MRVDVRSISYCFRASWKTARISLFELDRITGSRSPAAFGLPVFGVSASADVRGVGAGWQFSGGSRQPAVADCRRVPSHPFPSHPFPSHPFPSHASDILSYIPTVEP